MKANGREGRGGGHSWIIVPSKEGSSKLWGQSGESLSQSQPSQERAPPDGPALASPPHPSVGWEQPVVSVVLCRVPSARDTVGVGGLRARSRGHHATHPTSSFRSSGPIMPSSRLTPLFCSPSFLCVLISLLTQFRFQGPSLESILRKHPSLGGPSL